jgi:hypothetical protein
MMKNRWIFEAGRRVPRWLVETVDCTAIFNWPALVIERDDEWEIHPVEPVPVGSPPFLLRPATERHRGVATPTRTIRHSYEVRSPERRAAHR